MQKKNIIEFEFIDKAYRDSCEAARNAPHYSAFSDLDRSELQTTDQERAEFDARIGKGRYINPFTGEIGEANIGTHLPLEYSYY